MTRGALPASRTYQVQPTGPAEMVPADSGFLATAGAAFRSTEDEVSDVQERRIFRGYADLRDALMERGVPGDKLTYKPLLPWDSGDPSRRVPDKDAIWAAVQDARARQPGAFPGVPGERDAFEKGLLTRQGGRARDAAILSRGGFGAQMVGGIAGSFTDPFNVLTAPIGGGAKSVGQALLQGAVINGVLETIQTPDYIANKRRMGEDVTAGEAVANIGMAAAGGALLEGGFHIGGKVAPRVVDSGRGAMERALATAWPHLPQAIRSRWKSAAEIPDSALPDLAELLIGAGNMSLDERAAVTIVRREADMEAGNPFVPNGAGIARHAESMGQALQRIFDEVPGASAPPIGRDALLGGTARAAIVSGDARAVVKNRIGVVESGGSVDAANPLSSARGKYQFTAGTWLAYWKRRFGSGGMSEAQILAQRSDPRASDMLMDDLMADNAAMLRQAGAAETAGNLYLAHFLGQRGARRVLEADATAPVGALVGEAAVRANRSILEGKTAGDVIAWAHRKMGELPPAPIGARSVLARGEGDPALRIQAELDRADAELRAVRAEQDAARAAEDGEMVADPPHAARPEDAAEPVPVGDLIPERAGEPAMVEQVHQQQQAQVSPEVRALIEPLQRIVRERKRSLGNVEALAEAIGKSPEDVRAALDQLVVRGELRQRKDGGYTRPPVDRRPVDALTFVARNGGLSHSGVRGESLGHDLATIFQGANGRPQMMQGGPIVRRTGMTLDDMGERLWEAGYFGPPAVTPRPTDDAVLSMLEDSFRSGRKVHSIFDASAVAEGEARAAAIAADEEALRQADDHARALGHALTADELAGWLDVQRETGLDPDAALTEWFNREIGNSVWDAVAASDKEGYDQFLDHLDRNAEQARGDGAADGQRPGPFGGDAREGPPSGPDWADDPYEGWEPARLDGWTEPTGPAAEAQADSLLHDIQMDARAATPEPSKPAGVIRVYHSGSVGEGETGRWVSTNRQYAADYRKDLPLHYLDLPAADPRVNNADWPEQSAAKGFTFNFELTPKEATGLQMISRDAAPDMFGGATRDEARQALERRAQGGKSNGVDQKPAGSDGGLFDTGAQDQAGSRQMGFQLDPDSDPITPADLLRQLDEEDEAIRKMDACMVPKKPKPGSGA